MLLVLPPTIKDVPEPVIPFSSPPTIVLAYDCDNELRLPPNMEEKLEDIILLFTELPANIEPDILGDYIRDDDERRIFRPKIN